MGESKSTRLAFCWWRSSTIAVFSLGIDLLMSFRAVIAPTNDVGQHEVALQTTEADVSSMFDSISTRAATIVFSSFATLSRMLLSEENMSS